jgi:hypothetical protein
MQTCSSSLIQSAMRRSDLGAPPLKPDINNSRKRRGSTLNTKATAGLPSAAPPSASARTLPRRGTQDAKQNTDSSADAGQQTASMRNCSRIARARAPTARRSPISRVRSVTETSMMFMIPMPPTSNETIATPESRYSITVALAEAAFGDVLQVPHVEVSSRSWATSWRRTASTAKLPRRASIKTSNVSWPRRTRRQRVVWAMRARNWMNSSRCSSRTKRWIPPTSRKYSGRVGRPRRRASDPRRKRCEMRSCVPRSKSPARKSLLVELIMHT